MSEPVVRLFETEQHAQSAVDHLIRRGFPSDTINFVKPSADASTSLESITDRIAAGHVLRAHAKVYAAGVHGGRSLVAVRAPFGRAVLAQDIMDTYSPVGSGLRVRRDAFREWDDAAPLSSGLSMTTLLKDPAPLSGAFGLGTKAFGGKPMFGSLTGPRFALSSMFGLPLLSRGGKPHFGSLASSRFALSSMIGLPLLTKSRRER